MSSNSSKVQLVGVIGLGRMGSSFAANLAAAGFELIAYDRDPARAKGISGVKPAAQVADLAGCDAVVTSLPNDDALKTVALSDGGLVGILKSGAVHVSMSTASPELTRRIAENHIAHQQQFVAAPVLGNPDLAKAQKVFLLVSGKAEAIEHARPLLDKLG